jgi:hypothetical protein
MLPESWLLFKPKYLQDTRTAIASHHGTRRRRRTQPAARNAPQRSASHNIKKVKSNECQSVHCMLSLTHNTVCE